MLCELIFFYDVVAVQYRVYLTIRFVHVEFLVLLIRRVVCDIRRERMAGATYAGEYQFVENNEGTYALWTTQHNHTLHEDRQGD